MYNTHENIHNRKRLEKNENFIADVRSENEISSVEGGLNTHFKRYKFAGEDFTLSLFERADKKFFELNNDFKGEQRICIRGFVPLDSSLNINDVLNTALFRGYKIDYFFRSPYIDDKNVHRDGFVLLVSKNGPKRSKLSEKDSKREVTADKLKRVRREAEINYSLPDGMTCVGLNTESKLTFPQIKQLTKQWKETFNPGYNFKKVLDIVNDENVPKAFILNKEGELIAGAMAEIDSYGNFEITELFSKSKEFSIIPKYLIHSLTNYIKTNYPRNRIYMEANTSSSMPLIGAKLGFTDPVSVTGNYEENIIDNQFSSIENGKIESNVIIKNKDEELFKNFLFLQQEINSKTFAPSKINKTPDTT
ncbi:MAG: hypothetical protein AAGF07_00655 [Patescibacteria group bacterium]